MTSDDEIDRKQRALFREQQPIVDDLAEAGHQIASLWDGGVKSQVPDRAIEVLVRHLQGDYSFQIRWAIANQISGPYAKKFWDVFVDLFVKDSDVTGFKAKAAIGGLVGEHSDDKNLTTAIALAKDPRHGESRVALLDSLARKNDPRAMAAIGELTNDPTVGGVARQFLKRLEKGRSTRRKKRPS